MAAAAKPKSSAEIDGTAWWQALKSSNSFVPDPLDRVRPHPTPRVWPAAAAQLRLRP